MTPRTERTVWFHREYTGVTGGYVKHSHYFEHVLRMPGFSPVASFTGEPRDESLARAFRLLWPLRGGGAPAPRWEPAEDDVLFLAGVDWSYLAENGLEELPNPRVNLVQGVRHAHEGTELHGYLSRRAIRICVSQEVADAVSATGRTNGPVLTIPNATDITPFEPDAEGLPTGYEVRKQSIAIVGYKSPWLARVLSERLDAEGIRHVHLTEFLDRSAFLALLGETRIAVCLPWPEEGFYLPALEAMASGCLVVTMDCIGNRGFCHHDENCVIAAPEPDSLFQATKRALAMSAAERAGMHRAARNTVAERSLALERRCFHAILRDIDALWRAARRGVGPRRTGRSRGRHRPNGRVPRRGHRSGPTPGRVRRSEESPARRPLPVAPAAREPEDAPIQPLPAAAGPMASFLIAGVQKGGTNAIFHYLRQHPRIHMPERKELHFFDDEQLDWSRPSYERYDAEFAGADLALVRGEATPIYIYWRPAAERIHDYNPRLKLIVALRDPAARAYSHWRMEHARGWDPLTFARAIREGRARVVSKGEIPGQHRVFSYVERSFYAVQIERLLALFPRERIFFLTRADLLERRTATLDAICRFLDVPKWTAPPAHELVYSHAGAGVEPPSPEDMQYLRDLFRDDLTATESLIGRKIELEYP